MKKLFYTSLLLSALVFIYTGCLKKEIAVPAHEAGDVLTASVNMDADYKWQIYYDLEQNKVVSQNLKTDWDLGFETSGNGFHVVLNSSKSMAVYNTGTSDFESLTDTSGFFAHKAWDAVSGNTDSTAFGDWRTTKPVYLVDRGYNSAGISQGIGKIQVLAYDNQSFTIKYANLDNSNENTLVLTKDSSFNYLFFSFDNGTVSIEPPKTTWDICFTQYTELLPDGNTSIHYLVTGVLLNSHKTSASINNTYTFDEVNLATAKSTPLSQALNAIGYSWKAFNGSNYTINTTFNYIIKTSEGMYYKLRFIDFYNQSGEKGNPKFEFQQL
jgi:hypothetical protein